ncbi:MAG: dienelactone hydrolase family protein [Planctomycetota bacterium]
MTSRASGVPESIGRFFRPPRAYAGDFGEYRSPLLFDDGRPVKTAAGWRRRRKEILRYWHRVMGAWPRPLRAPKIEFHSSRRRDGLREHSVLVEVARDWPRMKGYVLAPPRARKRPAVLGVFYEPETLAGRGGRPGRDFCLQLAKRGFLTLAIGCGARLHYYPSAGNPRLQPLSFAGYVASSCRAALAGLPEVDASRIGVVGHSYGGKWAMFASCFDEEFACAAWSDPGIVFDESMPGANYWDVWYLGWEKRRRRPPWTPPSRRHPRTGAYARLVADGRNLHELHALMAPRPFLVSGGSCDPPLRWRALNRSVEVNRLLGHQSRVAMTSRKGHSPTKRSNAQLGDFFCHFLGLPR